MEQFDLRVAEDIPATDDDSTGGKIARMIDLRGSSANGHAQDLMRALTPDVAADIAHFLAVLHGRYPTLVDLAARKIAEPVAREWLLRVTAAFLEERDFLTALTVAAGPVNSTPGSEEVSQMIPHMAHSFATLASSERAGCAAGTCIAFLADWHAMRAMLDRIAILTGMEPAACAVPGRDECLAMADMLALTPPQKRAMLFGAEQYLELQRGLWQMLAARRLARV